MGRNRIGKNLTTPLGIAVDIELKESLLDEAFKRGITLSRMSAYALQRWINAQEHARHIEGMKK